MFEYTKGLASLSLTGHWKAMGFKGKFSATITIVKLRGRANLSIPPYPFKKYVKGIKG
jgi:hypothetical protein